MTGHERSYGFARGFRRRLRGLRMPVFNTRCSSTQASFLSQPSLFVHFRALLYHAPFNFPGRWLTPFITPTTTKLCLERYIHYVAACD